RLQRRGRRRRRGGAADRAGAGLAPKTPVKSGGMRTTIVVPCFNEAARLRPDGFQPLAEAEDVELLFIEDGSTDDTRPVLDELAARWPRARVLAMAENVGKAEGVRRGMLDGLARGAEVVGYLDADLATPADEMLRLREELIATGASAVLASRVALL